MCNDKIQHVIWCMARICLQHFFTVCVWVYKQVWNPTHTLPCLLVLHSCLVGEHATPSQSFDQLRPRKQTARTWKTQWFHVQVPQSVPWYSYLRDQIYADIVGRHECQWVINCYRLGHLEDDPPLSWVWEEGSCWWFARLGILIQP